MNRIPHVPLLICLGIALLAAAGVAASGKYDIFDAKGILSGPFSALMLLSASLAALMLVIALDWRVWLPRRRTKGRAFEQWLAADVLQTSAPQEGWTTLSGRFRGREITVSRTRLGGMRGLQWIARTASPLELRVVRLEMPRPPADEAPPGAEPPAAKAEPDYSSGDADFEALYAWQTHTPVEVLPVLKDPRARTAIKRLASFFAPRGKLSQSENGFRVQGGQISVLQVPAPDLAAASYSPEEALLVLNDLTLLAEHLEGKPAESGESAPLVQESPGDPLSAWLTVGCLGMAAIVLWMGATWAVAHFLTLAAAMVVFFVPAVLLAFLFLLGNAGASGRQAELEEAIQKEASELLRRSDELRNLRAKMAD